MSDLKVGDQVIFNKTGLRGAVVYVFESGDRAKVSVENGCTLVANSSTFEQFRDTMANDGPEVDILRALSHNQITLDTAINVLGGIKWDRNNTKEKGENV